MTDEASEPVSDRVLTIPNVLSFLRLLLIPVFIWVALGPENDPLAFALLAFSSVTDWLDGVIARRFHMVSRVGQLLDPIADRLFVASTIIVLAVREIVPWWLVVALLARDVVMFFVQLYVHRRGVEPLPVHYVGKAATACLLFGMPLLFLTTGDGAGRRRRRARSRGRSSSGARASTGGRRCSTSSRRPPCSKDVDWS